MQLFAGYKDEFRQHSRIQAAVMIGLAGGLGINFFIGGLFIPHLRAEFGWSASQVALAGLSTLLMAAVVPIAGRLTDIYGPRRVALVGVVTLPLSYLLMSFQTGDIRVFWLLDGMLTGLGITTMLIAHLRNPEESLCRNSPGRRACSEQRSGARIAFTFLSSP